MGLGGGGGQPPRALANVLAAGGEAEAHVPLAGRPELGAAADGDAALEQERGHLP